MRLLPSRAGATFAVLVVAGTAFALLQAMVIPVLPELQRALGTDQRTVTWVVSAYLLSAAIVTPILGRVGDAIGKKTMLLVCFALLTGGSLAAALAPDIWSMTAARVVQGAGGAILPLSFGIIRDVFPAERIPSALGVVGALQGIGASAGLVLAGPIVDLLGYRWLFLLPMLVVAATGMAAVLIIQPSPPGDGRMSWAPAPFLVGALGLFVLTTTQASQWGWVSPRTLGLYGVSALLAVLWHRLESRASYPLIDLKMMNLPAIRSGNAVSFLLGFAMFAIYAFVPQVLQAPSSTGYGAGAGVTESGLLMLPMASAVFVGGLIAAPLVRRAGSRKVVVLSSVVIAGCLVVVTVSFTATWGLVTALGVYGIAVGIALASLAALIIIAVPASQSGVAGAVNVNTRNIGGSVGTAVMATVVTAQLDGAGTPLASGYTIGFAILAVAMLAAAGLAAAIPRPVARTA